MSSTMENLPGEAKRIRSCDQSTVKDMIKTLSKSGDEGERENINVIEQTPLLGGERKSMPMLSSL